MGKGAVSEEQRAMWEAESRLGREPYVTPTKSRSKFGRLLDFLDSASRGANDRRFR